MQCPSGPRVIVVVPLPEPVVTDDVVPPLPAEDEELDEVAEPEPVVTVVPPELDDDETWPFPTVTEEESPFPDDPVCSWTMQVVPLSVLISFVSVSPAAAEANERSVIMTIEIREVRGMGSASFQGAPPAIAGDAPGCEISRLLLPCRACWVCAPGPEGSACGPDRPSPRRLRCRRCRPCCRSFRCPPTSRRFPWSMPNPSRPSRMRNRQCRG